MHRRTVGRFALLGVAALSLPLLGATCFPLFDLNAADTRDRSGPDTRLSVAIVEPEQDRTVSVGRLVTIRWTASNLTDQQAIATVLLRDRSDLSETVLAGGVRFGAAGAGQSVEWDTTDFGGRRFSVVVRVQAGSESAEAVSEARITVDARPILEFTDPNENITLAADPNGPGPSVTIRWSGFDPEGNGAAEIGIDPDADPNAHESGNEISLGQRDLPSTEGFDALTWDGTDQDGEPVGPDTYTVFARLDDGVNPIAFVNANRRIRVVNAAPFLEFIEPNQDVTLGADPNTDPPSVTIRWSGFDPDGDGTAEIGVDPDSDHESGNEVSLGERDLPTASEEGSLVWDGTDENGDRVEADTYNLFARLDDGVNDVAFVEADGRIIVPEPVETAIAEPNQDTEFLSTDDPLTIRFTLDERKDVLIDLAIDTDDNHQNGNERTILAQRLIESGTTEDSFDWDGTDSKGDAVPDSIYRLLLVISRETGLPQTVESPGLVFRRSSEDLPLIALLEPGTNRMVEPGSFTRIEWRDDDPNTGATIRLTIDDDSMPDEATETDSDETEILTDREAAGDGVLDVFNFQVPGDLAPGTYFVFAYVDRDGMAPFDNISVAAGRIIVPDPAAE